MTDSSFKLVKENFLTWSKDLKIATVENLGSNELSILFRSKKIINLWKYLIENIKSKQLAFLMIKNLLLKKLQNDNKTMFESCSQLSKEVSELNIELQRINDKIKQKRNKCYQSSKNIHSIQKSIDSNFLKTVFQEESLFEITSQTDLIEAKRNQIQSLSLNQLLSCKNQRLCETKEQLLYSCCAAIKDQITLVNTQYKNGFKNQERNDIADLWKRAIGLLSRFQPSTIKDALCLIIQEDSDKVN